jgi:hypothetical protein
MKVRNSDALRVVRSVARSVATLTSIRRHPGLDGQIFTIGHPAIQCPLDGGSSGHPEGPSRATSSLHGWRFRLHATATQHTGIIVFDQPIKRSITCDDNPAIPAIYITAGVCNLLTTRGQK